MIAISRRAESSRGAADAINSFCVIVKISDRSLSLHIYDGRFKVSFVSVNSSLVSASLVSAGGVLAQATASQRDECADYGSVEGSRAWAAEDQPSHGVFKIKELS